MIIGVDGNEANVAKKVGISEYAFELLIQFSNLKFKVQSSEFLIYLKDEPREDLPEERDDWVYRMVKPSKLWTQIGLPIDLYSHKPRPNVFFSPTHYAPRFSPVPTVVSVMDLSYIFYPYLFKKTDLYQLRNWTSYSVKKAAKVITISESSKNDIINYYKVPENKVAVVYPGIKMENSKLKIQSSKFIEQKYKIDGEYILFVGTLQPRKNIERLVEAFSKISKEKKIFLVIVGKKGWLFEEILKAPKKFAIEDKVKFLDFVSDEDLPLLYSNAKCFVLPSLYEGFGLPVLEAMKHGCPVITSNVSSLPEVGGQAAVYFDPENVDDISDKITMVISNEELRRKMIEKGYEQVKKFSWEKSARETLQILEKIAKL